MRRTVIFVVLALLFLYPAGKTFAACRSVSPGQSCPSGQYQREYALTIAGSAQCTSGTNGTYTVCCDYQTEANAVDSVRAPLCGASEERGKANSTCWNCGGGTYKCDGLDFSLGATDPFISQIRNPVSPGDTNMDQVWRIPNASIPSTFTYNGMEYSKPNGDLIVCGSNNLACGSSEECTNITHPDVSNRGRSGQNQCDVYSYTRISLAPGSSTPGGGTVAAGGDKACINIGDYSSHFNELSKAADTFPNGWIYILALPEWMDSISEFIKQHPGNNFMIRLHSPNAELSPDYANRWVTNLKTYAGNITNKVYLMPVNEPNNSGDRRVEPNDARLFISALSQGLDNEGLLNTKYIVTSPMIDPTSADVTGWLSDFCEEGYCDQFAAVAVAPYDFTGDMQDIKNYFPKNSPLIIAETGIKIDGQVVYGNDAQTAAYINSQRNAWQKQNAVAACIFSYDPDRNTNEEWIYSATQTQQALRGLGQSIKPIAAQATQPKTVRSTISYESCTAVGRPRIASKTKVPNLKSPGYSDSNKHTVTGVHFPQWTKIKGLVSLVGNTLKYPDMSRFARMLDGALPALQPLIIQEKYLKVVHPLSIVADTKVCVKSEDGEVKATPVKNNIKTEYKDFNLLVGATPYYAAILAIKPLSEYVYTNLGRLRPDLTPANGKKDCPDPPKARNVRERTGATGEAEFDEPEENSAKYRTKERWIPQDVLNNVFSLLCRIGVNINCNTDFDPSYWLNLDLISYLDVVNDDVGVDNQTGKRTGFVNSFAPQVLQKALSNQHGKTQGAVNQTLGSNSEPLDITFNYVNARGIQEHERLLECAISPQKKQKDMGLANCQFTEDVTADRPIATWSDSPLDPGFNASSVFNGSIQDAVRQATDGKIPSCVLEAVKYIETGSQADFSGQCAVNHCSAAGPFQVTTGAAPAPGGGWDTHCTRCGPSWADGSDTCPDGWPGNWPQNPSDPSPCQDVLTSAKRAVEMLKEKAEYYTNEFFGRPQSLTPATNTEEIRRQQDAIILAGNSYLGSGKPIGRLGNCSYGEFVYQHCDGSYTCTGSGKFLFAHEQP